MGVFIVLGILIGIGLGYGLFYFRYEHRPSIDELRANFAKLQDRRDHLEGDVRELEGQNKILKARGQVLCDQIDGYRDVISELSRYSSIIKKGNDKAKELSQLLSSFDPEIESKIEKLISYPHVSIDGEKADTTKKFF